MDPAAPPPRSAYERYLPYRRWFEAGYWLLAVSASAIGNTITVGMELRRAGLPHHPLEPAVWEWSSNLVFLALVPAVAWLTRRFPLHLDTWKRSLAVHAAGSVAFCALHVAGMVALRKLAYLMAGDSYDFGPLLRQFAYEYAKDVRTYVGMVLLMEGYRLLLRRLQGEASLLSAPDDAAPPVEPVERPERFLVRKLGREFLVAAADIEALQASGNYVNLRVRGREYPLRSTLAAIEARLDPARFRRVHRSHLVNLDHIASIEPLDTGDARIHLRDGAVVPCSRTYRAALRELAE